MVEVKTHPFFASVDWKALASKQIEPPFKPKVESEIDTSNFDPEFTQQLPEDSLPSHTPLSETVQRQFAGFSYDAHRNDPLSQTPFGRYQEFSSLHNSSS